MTREEKLRHLPRFKSVICNQMCSHKSSCFCETNEEFMACPYFHGYTIFGWPVRRICDISVDSYKLPDLRKQDPTPDDLSYWREPDKYYENLRGKPKHVYTEWHYAFVSGQTYLGLTD